jgi:Tfp pilus assembly major pilin PilA
MKHERGLTLIGLILVLGVASFFALLAMRLVPAYLEFFSIKRILTEVASNSSGGSVKDVQAAFDRRAAIDSITAIRGADLAVEKNGDGYSISASWEQKVPLVSNISALIEFEVEQ